MKAMPLPIQGDTQAWSSQRMYGWAALLGCCVAVVIGWADSLAVMWGRWLPTWDDGGALLERLTGGEGFYHHGPLVPLVSAGLAIAGYRRLVRETGRGWWVDERLSFRMVGIALMLMAALLLWMGTMSGANVVRGVALVLTLLGLITAMGGRDMLRVYGPAAGLLIFMIPVPLLAIVHLTTTLKMMAAEWGVAIARMVPGANLNIEGAMVLWQTDHGMCTMTIDSTCSGLRGLITLSWFTAVLITIGRGWRRAVLLAITCIPVAMACNVLRVAALVIVARQFGTETVHEETQLHGLIGLAGMGLGIFLLCGIDRACHRAPATTHAPPHHNRAGIRWPSMMAGCILMLATVSTWAMQPATSPSITPPPWQQIDREFSFNRAIFTAVDVPVNPSVRDELNHATIVHRRYLDTSARRGFDLMIIWHPTLASAIHPPDVCLTGNGSLMQDRHPGCGNVWPFICARVGNDAAAMNVMYTYFDGHALTSSYTLMRHANLFKQNRRGYAVIRLTAPTQHRHGMTHDELVHVANQLMPAVHQVLMR